MPRITQRFTREASFSRPANTTQYTAADGVSDDATTPTIMTFTGMAINAKFGGLIRTATLHKTDQDTTGADFDLYLFDTTVAVTGFNDNAAIAITDAEWATCVGFIAFENGDARSVVTGDLWTKSNLDIAYSCVGDGTLYGVLVARGTYTPASGETFTVRLGVETN